MPLLLLAIAVNSRFFKFIYLAVVYLEFFDAVMYIRLIGVSAKINVLFSLSTGVMEEFCSPPQNALLLASRLQIPLQKPSF
jgi:hypothetical protein